jgi:hypothetical protein
MNKRSILIASMTALVLMVASITLAAPMWNAGMTGPMGFNREQAAQLTEAQQADWSAWQEKNFQLKKERLQLMVKTGYLTQEQADNKLKSMEIAQSFRMKNKLTAPGARLSEPLTDEQKADLRKMFEQRVAIHKERLAEKVSAGQITSGLANAEIQLMQERFNNRLEKGFNDPEKDRGPMGRPDMSCGPRI